MLTEGLVQGQGFNEANAITFYYDRKCDPKQNAEQILPTGKKTECFFGDELGKGTRRRAYGSARGG